MPCKTTANLAAVAAAQAALRIQANVQRAQAALEKSHADVETAQADVGASRAALAEAQLNLGYTKVISPIDGVAGFRIANIGDLVGPSEASLLTTVSQVDPIYAQFPVSEQLALRVLRRWQADPRAPRTVDLELILADGSVYPQAGRPRSWTAQVDVTTGTVLVRGVFPNPGSVLRPGQYAKARAVTEMKRNALLVPQRAVVDQQGCSWWRWSGPTTPWISARSKWASTGRSGSSRRGSSRASASSWRESRRWEWARGR